MHAHQPLSFHAGHDIRAVLTVRNSRNRDNWLLSLSRITPDLPLGLFVDPNFELSSGHSGWGLGESYQVACLFVVINDHLNLECHCLFQRSIVPRNSLENPTSHQ